MTKEELKLHIENRYSVCSKRTQGLSYGSFYDGYMDCYSELEEKLANADYQLEGRELESGNVTRELYNPLEMRKAFEEGKQLQVKTTDGWIDITTRCETSSNAIDWDSHVFRIKSNDYRPFKDCNELIAYWYKKLDAETEYKVVKDNLRIPCIWVTNRDNGCREMILGFGGSAVLLPRVAKDMNELFEQYSFLDGSTCGVEK